MHTEVNFILNATNRFDIRKELIGKFLEELPGTGTGNETSKYTYYVEFLQDGNRIFLKRPALFNKGFDFGVHIENMNFGTIRQTSMPTHQNIYDDLAIKRDEDELEFNKLILLINRIYACELIPDSELRELTFTQGHSTEAIVKSIKWLFIEQDVTYWNWSGRSMLYDKLSDLWL